MSDAISNRLHELLSSSQFAMTAQIDVDKVTHKIVNAWANCGRLNELEKAMEQEAWLAREVGKGVGQKADKKRPREVPSASATSPTRPKASFAARHLLVKCDKSRKPVSRRTNESTEHVTAESAVAELALIREKILADGASDQVFARYASERSDCSSYKRGGDLGEFASGKMQKAFEDATRACAVGEMSPIVLSDSGYHLIWRYK